MSKIMRKKKFRFATIVHPDAIIASNVNLAEGAQIMAGVIIQTGVKVGRDTIINTGAVLDHDCNIGDNCHLAPSVVCSGSVLIGNNSHIGTGSIILENRSIGKNCIIAAGSTVFKDVPNKSKFIQRKYKFNS